MRADTDGDGIELTFTGLEREAKGYRFKMEASDDLPGLRRDQFVTNNKFTLPNGNLPTGGGRNKEMITVRVAAALGGTSTERRETDFVSVSTPFSK